MEKGGASDGTTRSPQTSENKDVDAEKSQQSPGLPSDLEPKSSSSGPSVAPQPVEGSGGPSSAKPSQVESNRGELGATDETLSMSSKAATTHESAAGSEGQMTEEGEQGVAHKYTKLLRFDQNTKVSKDEVKLEGKDQNEAVDEAKKNDDIREMWLATHVPRFSEMSRYPTASEASFYPDSDMAHLMSLTGSGSAAGTKLSDEASHRAPKNAFMRPTPPNIPRYQHLTANLLFAVFLTGGCSGFQHGYNMGIVTNMFEIMGKWMVKAPDSVDKADVELQKGKSYPLFVSFFSLGALLGSLIVSFLTLHHSKKNGLKLNNFLVLVGAQFQLFAKIMDSFTFLLIGRFIVGVNAALNAGLATMYLVEIAPFRLRGGISSVYSVSLSVAILVANVLSIEAVMGTKDNWHWLFAIPVVPAAIQIIGLTRCPESPKYVLIETSDEERAKKVLVWLRGDENIDAEISRIRLERKYDQNLVDMTLKEMLSSPALRKALRIATIMMLTPQLTGITVARSFSTRIFQACGLERKPSQYATITLSVINIFVTLLSVAVVDRWGRKTLMYVGISGMLVTNLGILACLTVWRRCMDGGDLQYCKETVGYVPYLNIVVMNLFVTFYAIGPGPIPW
jgi:SP family facilitated glucose transporter-like MFS transporter 1